MLSLALSVGLWLGCAYEAADVPGCVDCLLVDPHNYVLLSELRVGELPVAEGLDARVRWDGLTRDIRGEPLDPWSLGEARLIGFRDLEPSDVAYGLTHDSLAQSNVTVFVTCEPRDASCALSEFGMLGNQVDIQQYMAEGNGTWLLALGARGTLAVDQLAFLTPTAGVAAQDVALADDTSRLDVAVGLRNVLPLELPAHVGEISVDWADVTRNGLGDPLDADAVDELWVARFDEPLGELEDRFFELDALADAVWTLDVAGESAARLEYLEGGTPFPGIDDAGTWLLALRCRGCTNPAPQLLAVLEPAS
jgi:hypothetical protein